MNRKKATNCFSSGTYVTEWPPFAVGGGDKDERDDILIMGRKRLIW